MWWAGILVSFEHLNQKQFGTFSDDEMSPHQLVRWANQDVDIEMEHRDRVDKLVDSMREHGYDSKRPDEPIQVLTHKGNGAVLEGHHRVWAAHYAGLSKVPVRRREVDQTTWQHTFGEV